MSDRLTWDQYFMTITQQVAERSTCTRAKVGAIIVRDKNILATGYNGAPAGMPHCTDVGCLIYQSKTPNGETEENCFRTIHAEMNAILFMREPLSGFTMYVWPMLSCHRCAVHIIQAGITTVIAPYSPNPRWDDSIEITRWLLREANVNFREISANDTD